MAKFRELGVYTRLGPWMYILRLVPEVPVRTVLPVDGGKVVKGFKPTHRMADTHNDSRVSEMASQIAKEFREKCPGHLKPRLY
jgi:pyruvate/2-oxoglutarate/acetoin dehydrogenase E1 component